MGEVGNPCERRTVSDRSALIDRRGGWKPLARGTDVVPLLVLHRRVGADDRRPGERRRHRLTDLGIQQSRSEASALDVPQHGTGGVARSDRRLPAEPGERERASRVDLSDARRHDLRALREVPEPRCGGAGIQALDESDRVGDAGLLDEQALEEIDTGVELLVDRRDDPVDRLALLHDLADVDDHLVEAARDLPELQDHRDQVDDEGGNDERDRDDRDHAHRHDCEDGCHQPSGSASSRITSREPP